MSEAEETQDVASRQAAADRDQHTITFAPPLPCVTIDGDRWCGKPATVAQVYPTGGYWLLQPICRDCAAKLAAIYLGGEP